MSAQFEVQLGSTAFVPVSTKDQENGTPTDADALPTVTAVTVNGVGIATTGYTIAQAQDDTPANITGEYHLTFDSTGRAKSDLINVYVSVAIGGVTVTTAKSVKIVDDPANRPYIN